MSMPIWPEFDVEAESRPLNIKKQNPPYADIVKDQLKRMEDQRLLVRERVDISYEQQKLAATAIIAAAKDAARQKEEDAKKEAEEKERAILEKQEKREKREKRKNMTPEEKALEKEKQLQKLISPVVVKSISKWSKDVTRDEFKKHAAEVRTQPPRYIIYLLGR
jgi:histone-lysine N-methyltransferase SETD2